MALGRMLTPITINSVTNSPDSEGFPTITRTPVVSCKAYREGRHGSEAWRNRAACTDATDLFVIRDPHVTIKTDMEIVCGEQTFQITSVENVKGRGMYLEILGREVVPSGQH